MTPSLQSEVQGKIDGTEDRRWRINLRDNIAPPSRTRREFFRPVKGRETRRGRPDKSEHRWQYECLEAKVDFLGFLMRSHSSSGHMARVIFSRVELELHGVSI
jgi:hypothetical protein